MQHTNTFDAHRVAQYAETKGKGNEITERLLKAYYTESKLISDHDVLVDLACEVGLDKNEVAELLKTNAYAAQVRFDEKQAQENGVQDVPLFVFTENYAASYAHQTEVFVDML